MNETVNKRVERIREFTRSIQDNANRILSELGEVKETGDLYVVENILEAIERSSNEARKYVQDTYDEFD